MRRVLASLESSLVIEPYFEGQEWSIDLVVSESAVMMIRATEKAIRIVEGCPTCIGYRLVSSEETLAELGGERTSLGSRTLSKNGDVVWLL